ncbi:MAG: surface carbohydrate biosynthesis protein [Dongiaceae bacterium]
MAPKLSKIIYFPMEIASRELDSRLLLAAVAAARGFEIVLGQKWLIEHNIERMTPGIYCSKTLTVRDARMLKRAREAGYAVVAVDEEMPGLIVQNGNFWWVSPDAVKETDAIFLSGGHNAEAFAEVFGRSGRQIQQACNPRWDLMRPKLRSIYDEEVAEIKRRFGEFILVNSNLGFTNSEKGDADEMIRNLLRMGKIDLNDPRQAKHLEEGQAMEAANRVALLELLPRLGRQFPNLKIVLRPHPSERMESWREWAGGIPNLAIIREGPAIPWILASRLLIHTNCTTGVEAIALDKPSICIVPSDLDLNDWYLSARVNPVAKTVDQTIVRAARILENPGECYDAAMHEAFAAAMSYRSDRLGAEQIADELDRLGAERGWRADGSAQTQWRPLAGYRWKQRDKNVRGKLIPSLDLGQLRARLEQLCLFLDIGVRPRVELCGSKVALVSARRLHVGTRLRRALSGL